MILLFLFSEVKVEGYVETIEVYGTGIVQQSDLKSIGTDNKKYLIIRDGITEIGPKAFLSLTSLTTASLPQSITYIRNSGFEACSSLISVNFDNLTQLITIESGAFRDVPLTNSECILGPNLTSIHSEAFRSCRFTKIEFQNQNTLSINSKAFSSLTHTFPQLILNSQLILTIYSFLSVGIENILLGPDVQISNGNPFCDAQYQTVSLISTSTHISIENNIIYNFDKTSLFSYSTSFTDTFFQGPPTLRVLKNNSMRGSKILKANFSTVEEFEYFSFYFSQIQEILLDKVKIIWDRAFYGSKLVSVTLPEGITKLGVAAFTNCNSLIYVHFPSTLVTFDGAPLGGCSKLTNVTFSENHPILKRSPDGMIFTNDMKLIVFVPNSFDSITIPNEMKSIPEMSFQQMGNIQTVKFHDQLNSIESYAFAGCSGLKNVTFPTSLTYIGPNAFTSCTSLKLIFFPSGIGITAINGETFDLCTGITEIDFQNSKIASIGKKAFGTNSKLTTIYFSQTLTKISELAFLNCIELKEITLTTNDVMDIAYNSFLGCKNLAKMKIDTIKISSLAFRGLTGFKEVEFSAKVTEIGSSAFSGCSNLTNLIFLEPSELKTIYANAFGNCISLTDVYLPGSLLTAKASIFTGCTNLVNVYINNPEKFETFDHLLYEKGKDKIILCPAGLTSAIVFENTSITGDECFSGCLNLNSIYLSPKLETISDYTFYQCKSLMKLNIPIGITLIGKNPFLECDSLKMISFCGTSDVNIKYNNENGNPFPNNVLYLVTKYYTKDNFMQKNIIKSHSIDSFGCPIMPTKEFTKFLAKKMPSSLLSFFKLTMMNWLSRM